MCCNNLWKKMIPFAIALMLGISAVGLFNQFTYFTEDKTGAKLSEVTVVYSGDGKLVNGRDKHRVEIAFIPRAGTNKLQVISKPHASYTDAARQNATSGTVRLRVTFLSSGQIGDISPVFELPDGLTDEAIKAAKNIRFQPATVDGKAVTVSKFVEYNFTIY